MSTIKDNTLPKIKTISNRSLLHAKKIGLKHLLVNTFKNLSKRLNQDATKVIN